MFRRESEDAPGGIFSKKLTLAEQNHDVGNLKHWLAGAKQPFMVLTDHKNLEYLHTAKRINSRQACWVLFFTMFNFTMVYRPKLLLNCWVNAIKWKFDREIGNTIPYHVPEECTYVPPRLRSTLITWAYTSPASGHLGTWCTLELIQEKCWWLSVLDVNHHVSSCSMCTQAKVPCH